MSLQDADANGRRARTCRWLLESCRVGSGLAAEGLSPDAVRTLVPSGYQEIILDLYLAEHEGRRVYQSYLAGSGPPGRTHRQVARLEKLGVVCRSPDPNDHRRLDVTLTFEMKRILDLLLDALERSALQHFVERLGPFS